MNHIDNSRYNSVQKWNLMYKISTIPYKIRLQLIANHLTVVQQRIAYLEQMTNVALTAFRLSASKLT